MNCIFFLLPLHGNNKENHSLWDLWSLSVTSPEIKSLQKLLQPPLSQKYFILQTISIQIWLKAKIDRVWKMISRIDNKFDYDYDYDFDYDFDFDDFMFLRVLIPKP